MIASHNISGKEDSTAINIRWKMEIINFILANMFNFALRREYLTVYVENKYACTLMLVTKEI